jgi:hypothetical protein
MTLLLGVSLLTLGLLWELLNLGLLSIWFAGLLMILVEEVTLGKFEVLDIGIGLLGRLLGF